VRLSSFARIAGLLVLTSCIAPVDTDQATGPLSLSVVSGNNQSAPPGAELPSPIVARVEDSRGRAVLGQVVNFRVVAGGGSVFAGVAITGRDGIVQERWTLGSSGPQQVEARAIDNETGAKLTFAIFTATLADVAPPVVSNVTTSPASLTPRTPFDLTAVVSDTFTGGSNIAGATYSVDSGPPVAMFAQDGAFDQQNEAVRAHVPPFASGGTHTFCVTGRDAAGNVSSPSCIAVVVAEDAVYVSPAGNDAGNGTPTAPLRTIGAALALAESFGKSRINVAQGTYPEHVQLRSGISLYGGYDPATWTRAPATFITTIGPGPASTALAVEGDNVVGITIDGFTIRSGDAVVTQQSAYGILLTSSVVTISGNHVIAGNGAAGLNGLSGFAGGNGVAGFDGEPGRLSGPEGAGGAGGSVSCNGAFVSGGTGGRGGPLGTEGQNGETGSGSGTGGSGGLGGPGGTSSPLPPGENGADGSSGINGAAGLGGADFTGMAGLGGNRRYAPADAFGGENGRNGGSGGGGGGGGGVNAFLVNGGGNGGGGGGSGGCAGDGGAGGGGGGGSFGIVGVASTLTISGNTIETGNGGAGGAAGGGAAGGQGAAGGLGATNDAPSVGAGGNGGAGGAGGAGGLGGGGGGGPSVGIVSQAGSLTQTGNAFVLGNGGVGGTSPGGNAGSTGLRTNIKS
jgi:hypothetical protein